MSRRGGPDVSNGGRCGGREAREGGGGGVRSRAGPAGGHRPPPVVLVVVLGPAAVPTPLVLDVRDGADRGDPGRHRAGGRPGGPSGRAAGRAELLPGPRHQVNGADDEAVKGRDPPADSGWANDNGDEVYEQDPSEWLLRLLPPWSCSLFGGVLYCLMTDRDISTQEVRIRTFLAWLLVPIRTFLTWWNLWH